LGFSPEVFRIIAERLAGPGKFRRANLL
jgi:hypothetical protein